MLRYLYTKEIFQEIPNEFSLGVAISGCQIRCQGCHSPELWKDEGTPLNIDEIDSLIKKHEGITCVCLFGGEHDLLWIEAIMYYVKKTFPHLRTAWYCGLDDMKPLKEICKYLDYLKIGSFKQELGGLDSPDTNQKLYRLFHRGGTNQMEDITNLIQKQNQ